MGTDGSSQQTSRLSIPALVVQLREMLIAYLKQETFEPIKNLGRVIVFGMVGSLALSLGGLFLLVALLRALELETGTVFAGKSSWAPYGICAGCALVVMAVAGFSIVRRPHRREGRP